MMAQKQQLHELLKEDQEPFRLQSYVADRRSQLNKSTLQLRKQNYVVPEPCNLCKNACILWFRKSPDVRRSPFIDFPSPAMGPCKSPNSTVFLHVPSKTAALLVEAARRIQSQQHSKPEAEVKNVGSGLFGSVMNRIKDRSKSKKHGEHELWRNCELKSNEKMEGSVKTSCSCNRTRLSRDRRCEESEKINGHFTLRETLCPSSPVGPFRFSLHKGWSASCRRTPEFCSPVAPASRRLKQEKANYGTRNSNNVRGEQRKEQCSPVSVLDSFSEEEGHECGEAEEGCDLKTMSYANVKRINQQLLYRLRRFEKLAELNPLEFEKRLLEDNLDDELEGESLKSENHESSRTYTRQAVDNEVFRRDSIKMSSDTNKLVCDPTTVKEESKIICFGNKEAVCGRVCSTLETWKNVEFDAIDMLVGLDFKKERGEWKYYPEQVEETAAEVGLGIFVQLVEELTEELVEMDRCLTTSSSRIRAHRMHRILAL